MDSFPFIQDSIYVPESFKIAFNMLLDIIIFLNFLFWTFSDI